MTSRPHFLHRPARREAPGMRQAERPLGEKRFAAGRVHDAVGQQVINRRQPRRIEPADRLDDTACRMMREQHQRRAARRVAAKVDESVEPIFRNRLFGAFDIIGREHAVVRDHRLHTLREIIRLV